MRKDDRGYGLTLCGEGPVEVQTIRPGGAADRAGIREHDIIIKVNGQRVTEAGHKEVVDMILSKTPIYFSHTGVQKITVKMIVHL